MASPPTPPNGTTNAFAAMFGPKLLRGGDEVDTATALGNKTAVGIYFSAHWCPPCRGFTPVLSKKYLALKAAGKAVEIVFASSDQDQTKFDEYFAEMPWLALPFGERDLKATLSKKFGVNGIPALIFLDGDGTLITDEGRGGVSADSFVEDFPYRPKPLNDVANTTSGINNKRSLIVLMEAADDETKNAVSAVLATIATAAIAIPEDQRTGAQRFFTAKGGGPVTQIRKACGLPAIVAPHPHALKEIPNENKRWGCDGCGKSGAAVEKRHQCPEGCNFDYCGECVAAAGKEISPEVKAPCMVLVDLGDEGAFYVPEAGKEAVTATNIAAFLSAVGDGKLGKKKWGQA